MNKDTRLEELLHATQSDDPRIRSEAISQLGHSYWPGIADKIADVMLIDPDGDVRRLAAGILSNAPPAHLAGSLIQALQDSDPQVRANAADALGRTRNPIALEPLHHTLQNDVDPKVRYYAAIGLLFLRDRNSVQLLIKALQDEQHYEVRTGILEALSTYENEPVVVQPIIAALTDPHSAVRASAARSLGCLKNNDAVPALLEALNDSEAGVRVETIQALGELKDSRAVEAVIHILDDFAEVGLYALGEIGDRRAAAVVRSYLAHPNNYICANAIDAYVSILGAESINDLVLTLNDSRPVAQARALRALGLTRSPEAISHLAAWFGRTPDDYPVLQDDDTRDYLQPIAAYALFLIGSPAINALIELLNNSSEALRAQIVIFLGEIKDEKALATLREISSSDSSPTVRQFADEAIQKIENHQ